jgi:hypothetical protein
MARTFSIAIIISAFGTEIKTPFCQCCGFGSGTFLTGSETELFNANLYLKLFSDYTILSLILKSLDGGSHFGQDPDPAVHHS